MSSQRPDSSIDHLEILLEAIPPDGTLIELGSGWSTVYLAERLALGQRLISYESHEEWFYKIVPHVVTNPQVEYSLTLPSDEPGPYGSMHRENPWCAREWIGRPQYEEADVVFIDGLARGACAVAACLRMQSGEIFLHDAERDWYDWAVDLLDQNLGGSVIHPSGPGHGAEMRQWTIG